MCAIIFCDVIGVIDNFSGVARSRKGCASALANKTSTAEKILAQVKGLRNHLQPDEQPLLALPAIWDNGQEKRSAPCDVIVTNQRLLGYYLVSFPRERLFLDSLTLREETVQPPTPVFGRQEIRTQFESSNLAITILFVGGIMLEVGGVLLWDTVGQTIGLPLCIAGFVMVFAAIVQRRQQRR